MIEHYKSVAKHADDIVFEEQENHLSGSPRSSYYEGCSEIANDIIDDLLNGKQFPPAMDCIKAYEAQQRRDNK